MSVAGNILALDAGSSGLKATLFSPIGTVIAAASEPYGGGSAAHRAHPESWWRATIGAVRALGSIEAAAIVLTGTMENLIPITANGRPTTDALLYSDPCGTEPLERLAPTLPTDAAQLLGNAPEPLMTAFKLAWLREHEEAPFTAARWFLPGAKDFLAFKLTGEAATDPVCGATTGLMDFSARDWSTPVLAALALDPETLPPVRRPTDIVGALLDTSAQLLGLADGIPVINGCGDGGATTLGGGADAVGDTSIYLGTSGWVARIAPPGGGPRPFYRLPHPIADATIEIAPILSGGAASEWARQALGLELPQAELLARTADGAPGDALFLPYLNGERSPFVDLELRGGFLGLSAHDTPGALYYAVLEGVAFAIASNLDAMGGHGSGRVSLVGGGALSAVWPQIIADVLQTEVYSPADPVAAPSFGAFRIARAALGLEANTHDFSVAARPRPERAARLDRQRRRYAAATAFARTLNSA